MDEHGNRPEKEELFVILAGPAMHLPLQLAGYLLFLAGILPSADYELFTFNNVTIFLFNLLPIIPLDGGKLLFLGLSRYKPYLTAQHGAFILSSCFLLVYMLIALMFSPLQLNIWLISGFLAYSIYREYKQRHYSYMRFLLERYYGKQPAVPPLRPLIASSEETLLQVLLRFQKGCKHPIVVEENGKKITQLDENELLHAYFSEKRVNAKVNELLYAY